MTGVLGSSLRCAILLPCMQTHWRVTSGKERRDRREQFKTSGEALANSHVLSGLPRRYRCSGVACDRLRVVVCDNRAARPSAMHSRGDPNRRRRPRNRKPWRLPAKRTARTSWRPRAFVRAGTLTACRKAGRNDHGCRHLCRACPIGCTQSSRRSLGGNELSDLRGLARRERSTDVYPRGAGSDGVMGTVWMVEGFGYGRSYPLGTGDSCFSGAHGGRTYSDG
jgi:hypothetical protein